MKNTKRIIFNTGAMYMKMFITIALSLYTSRVVLDALGVVDFGLYSVVASVVAMFGFLNSSMIASVQRHLAYEIGKNNLLAVRMNFNAGLIIHILIALIVLILAETVGIWFVKNHLTIPPERMDVALWAFHFAMFSFMCTIVSVPFQSMLNAKERMVYIAVIGVIEAVLQLAIALLIAGSSHDRLKLYATLMCGVFVVSLIIYSGICYLKYRECRPMIVKELAVYRELAGFAGWNLFGTLAVLGRTQGAVILLNIFLGPAINAAYSVAHRVNAQLSFFSSSITKAISPQIVKSYGAGNRDEYIELVFQSSKFTFFMLYIVSLPILLECDYILDLWLKKVPDYAVIFCRLIIINSLIDSIATAMIDAALATGRIRNYQIIVGSVVMLNVPFSFIALNAGAPPYSVVLICIAISLIATALRLGFLNRMVGFPVANYLREVARRIVIVIFITLICTAPFLLNMPEGLSRFSFIFCLSIVVNITAVYLLGMKPGERDYIKGAIERRVKG